MEVVTSDTHLGHANIIRYCHRPWLNPATDLTPTGEWVSREVARKRADEMDEALILEWNKMVSDKDTVYHLGDFCFGSPLRYVHRLNGRIVIIWGSHDKDTQIAMREGKLKGKMETMGRLASVTIRGVRMELCHCAMRVWEKSHHGAIHLYGHSHDTLPDLENSMSTDCGVDAAARRFGAYRPFSVDEILDIMAHKQQAAIDHHGRGKARAG